jgi:hypothetical protein
MLPTGWDKKSNYAKDHSPKRGNKVGVSAPNSGASDGYDHDADINQAEGNSGMNTSVGVKDAKHQQGARANALDTWKRGVTGGHAADGAHDRTPSKQHTGHAPYHKANPSAHANGLAMWQEGVDSKHDEKGEHAVPNQFNNKK